MDKNFTDFKSSFQLTGEPEPETSDDSEDEHKPAVPEEGEAEPEVKGKGVTSYTPKGEFHAMDCVDMVIGMARGDASRIWDYYTRDRYIRATLANVQLLTIELP